MNDKAAGISAESTGKVIASELSTRQLLELLEKALHLPAADAPAGSRESLQSYFKMTRQFAAMANSYQDLIPAKYDALSIGNLSDFLLGLNLEEYSQISGNLWPLLDSAGQSNETTNSSDPGNMSGWESEIERVSAMLPDEIDLTDESQDHQLEKSALDLMDAFPSYSKLKAVDQWLASGQKVRKNALHLAVKMARSKYMVSRYTSAIHVSLIVAMYNEHNRILPRQKENPNGEDFVRRKARQMAWLFDDSPITFDLLFVDDGCPNQSGDKAKKIIASERLANAKVLFLKDAIEKKLPVVKGLNDTDESRKGGSIHYGMWQSLQDHRDENKNHVIVYTDADMAAPVHQLGLLLIGLDGKTRVAIGSRYDEGSICRGPWGPNGEVQGLTDFDRLMVGFRGLVFSGLFPQTGTIIDTQCALKAFGADLLNTILSKTSVRTFSFDVELLILSAAAGTSIAVSPIYWHDSTAESNFWRYGSNDSGTAD